MAPGTRDVGKNIKELKQANKSKAPSKKRPHRQVIAIAISQARKAGANIPKKGRRR